MSDIHALVGAYAVDALDDDERAAFEQHLAECPACQAEVAGLRETAALLGSTASAPPPGDLRDRVLAAADTVRPLPPVTPDAPAPARRRRFRPALLAAAAAVVIGLGAGVAVVQPWADDEPSQSQVSAVERIRSAADAETYTQRLDGGAEATVIRSRELNQAVVITHDMPPPPSGKVYELWLQHDEVGMVAAGLMTGDEREVVLEGDPATAVGFGITVEPAGGSEEPTLPPVTTIDFESA